MFTSTISEQQAIFLRSDNLTSWTAFGCVDGLDAWVRENMLYALENCPRVIQAWQLQTSSELRALTLAQAVATSLENVLSDEEKCAVLNGKCHDKASQVVHDGFTFKGTRWWRILSPSWVGPANGVLRETVVELGWYPELLCLQIPDALHSTASKKWFNWVSFPYSVAVLCKELHDQIHDKYHLDREPTMIHTCMPNANPMDVALAQHLSEVFATAKGGELQYKLTAHPDVAPLAPEDHLRLKTLAQLYLGLDALEDLRRAVCEGHLPLGEQGMDVGLPELGPTP